MRPLGEIISNLEELIFEMTDDHYLQHGDILALTKNYMEVHVPESKEEYTDGSNPVYYYGHKDYIKLKKEK